MSECLHCKHVGACLPVERDECATSGYPYFEEDTEDEDSTEI